MNRPPTKKTSGLEEGHGEHADDYERPPQDGEHVARRDHPRGEDVMGNLENNREARKTSKSLTPKTKPANSLLTIDEKRAGQMNNLIKNLRTYLDKSKGEKKELIRELNVTGSKSILDESNIIGE